MGILRSDRYVYTAGLPRQSVFLCTGTFRSMVKIIKNTSHFLVSLSTVQLRHHSHLPSDPHDSFPSSPFLPFHSYLEASSVLWMGLREDPGPLHL